MSIKVQKILEPVRLGEGPHWDEQAQALYYVCINGSELHKYMPSSGKHTTTTLDGRVGFVVPLEGTTDRFVVGVERKFLLIQWDGQDGSKARVVQELAEVDKHEPNNRINDGKCDPKGRLFAGTMGHEDPPGNFTPSKGSLFRLEGTKLTHLDSGIGISNGLAWDVKAKAMYYTDSLEKNIRRYDYDVQTGEISNKRYIFDFEANNVEGLPDGSTIDTDGNLWIAVFNGGCVLNIDPRTGKLLRKIQIPTKQVTSVSFGGPNFDILFVTTANINANCDQAGATYTVTGLHAKDILMLDSNCRNHHFTSLVIYFAFKCATLTSSLFLLINIHLGTYV